MGSRGGGSTGTATLLSAFPSAGDANMARRLTAPPGQIPEPGANHLTLTGSSGRFLNQELTKWREGRKMSMSSVNSELPQKASDWIELNVLGGFYDKYPGPLFDFVYDVLQLSSGRDKFCAVVQGYAKLASASLCRPDSERFFMYRGIEDSISEGRKVFRLFKEIREIYKVRRGYHRLQEGMEEGGVGSIPMLCGLFDVCGHTCSFFYFFYDNLLWAASVGIVRTKEVPRWQQKMWQGGRTNGPVVKWFGGVSSIKSKKNYASIIRLMFAFTANALLLKKAVEKIGKGDKSMRPLVGGPDDPRLFHALELFGMTMSFRVLISKLGYSKETHARLGLLSMCAALCGIWVSWRKVVKKKFGTKKFMPVALTRKSPSDSNLLSLAGR